MACVCISQTPEQKEQKKVNNEIERQIKQEKKEKRIKLLLLGTGESGKSTIAKQMKIIHLNGYENEEEKIKFKPIVYGNIITNIKTLIEAIEKLENFNYKISEENMSCIENIMNFDEESLKTTEISQLGFSSSLVEDIKKVWKDEAIQQAFNRSSEFQLCDSAEYFFNQIDRICQENYIPTKEDILRVRAKTTGINEIEFKIDDFLFGMTDVGGQRSERRKWIHCFEDVTAIIFCVALSEYDQKLFEDENTNRMSESLKLFSDITNAKWFFNTPIILFLNKKDIFKRKIQKIPLSVCFGDYKGENTFEDASNFIEQKFKSLVQNPKKLVYVYKTCATDTNNVQRVFKTIKEVFIARYLEQIGFLGDQSMNSNNARPRGKSFSNSPTEITTK